MTSSPLEKKIESKIKELETKWTKICQEMYATHFTESIKLTSDEKIELGAIPTVIKVLKELLE